MIPLPDPKKTMVSHSDAQLLCMLLWGEARGETREVKEYVACVVRNRVQRPGWWGTTWKEVILKPYQFSCFLKADPNSKKLKNPTKYEPESVWEACSDVAEGILSGAIPDTTKGATHYYDKSIVPPAWTRGGKLKLAMDTPKMRFYKEV